MTKGKWSLSLHPFAFAAYPVLHLYLLNMDEARPVDVFRLMAVVFAGAAALLVLTGWLLKDRTKSSVVVTLVVFACLNYGEVARALGPVAVNGYVLGRALFLLPAWCTLLLIATIAVARTRRPLVSASRYMSLVGIASVAIVAGQIALCAAKPDARSGRTWAKYVASSTSGDRALKLTPGTRPPDIYYFLLDEYAGEEVLRGRFGYDNSAFLGFLRDRGFFIAPDSRSNYLSTHLCLPALLNCDYLDVLSARAGTGPVSTAALTRMATDCGVVRLLKGAGYRFVFVPSGFQVPSPRAAADEVLGQGAFDLTEFDRVFLDNSILQPLNSGAAGYRKHVLRSLQQLDSFPIPDRPTFVFAHITVTHRPYLFDAEGNRARRRLLVKKGVSAKEFASGYTDQIEYVNRRMRPIVDRIIANSKTPPIIVLQADHGYKEHIEGTEDLTTLEMSSILSAFYLPGDRRPALPDSMSPVNTFRMIFRHYFGADFDPIEDRTFTMEEKRGRVTLTRVRGS